MSTHEPARWSLDPKLARDTIAVGDLPLSRLLLNADANYPWIILVPRRPRLVELIDLDDAGQLQLLQEISRVAAALKDITRCDKLNIAALGNVVPQLHVHIIARFKNDAAWPNPVWGKAPPRAYRTAALAALCQTLRGRLDIAA